MLRVQILESDTVSQLPQEQSEVLEIFICFTNMRLSARVTCMLLVIEAPLLMEIVPGSKRPATGVPQFVSVEPPVPPPGDGEGDGEGDGIGDGLGEGEGVGVGVGVLTLPWPELLSPPDEEEESPPEDVLQAIRL